MSESLYSSLSLTTLKGPFRYIAIWLVISLAIGYTTGLGFVYHTTGVTPDGVNARYRGNQPDIDSSALPVVETQPPDGGEAPELLFEKSYAEMLNITHTHMLSMASFFALVCGVFALSARSSPRLKSILIVEPFVALITSFSALWLMRYVSSAFSIVLMISSASMAVCFYLMVALSLRELIPKR